MDLSDYNLFIVTADERDNRFLEDEEDVASVLADLEDEQGPAFTYKLIMRKVTQVILYHAHTPYNRKEDSGSRRTTGTAKVEWLWPEPEMESDLQTITPLYQNTVVAATEPFPKHYPKDSNLHEWPLERLQEISDIFGSAFICDFIRALFQYPLPQHVAFMTSSGRAAKDNKVRERESPC